MRGYKLNACEVSQVDERVRTTAETYALGVIDDVSAVLAGDAVEQWLVNQVGMVGSVQHLNAVLAESVPLRHSPVPADLQLMEMKKAAHGWTANIEKRDSGADAGDSATVSRSFIFQRESRTCSHDS